MSQDIFTLEKDLFPPRPVQTICVCLGSDMRGCRTCEGVGLAACRHAFEQDPKYKKRREQLWKELAKRGLPQSDVDIWPINTAMAGHSQTAPTGIRLTHVPTGLKVEYRSESGTKSLIMAAKKLYEGLRKAQEGNLT